jgi:hypothetical protein
MNHNHREYTRISTTSVSTTTTPPPEQNGHIISHDGASSHSSLSQQQQQQQQLSSAAASTVTSTTLPPRTTTERIMDKCYAAIWVVVASLVFHYTDSAHVYLLTTDSTAEKNQKPTANVVLLQCVMIGLGINTVLFVYLLIYLPYVKGLPDSTAWDVYCPRVIPCMTLIGLGIFIVLIRATYPIWGFLAPIIIGIEAMGALFACHFIPVGLV